MLKLALNDRSPLRLYALDISLLMLTTRETDEGRTVAVIGASVGGGEAVEVLVGNGDVLELVGSRGHVHRLRAGVRRGALYPLSLQEVGPDELPKARLAGRLGPAEARRTMQEQSDAEVLPNSRRKRRRRR